MSDNLTVVLIVLGSIVIPTWLTFNFITKMRGVGRTSAADSAALASMARIAERLEARMAIIERILDAESPAWRSNLSTGEPYDRKLG